MSLALSGVRAGYGVATVLDGVDLALAAGEMVGVIGPNGSGKTTALRLLSGQLRPSAGSASLEGVDLASYGRFELARSVAVVAQAPSLPAGYTVAEVVAMGRTPHLGLFGAFGAADASAVRAAIARADLVPLAARRVDGLSGGERQRVVLARALAQAPRYLLLDEPTNHLDLRYQVEVLRLARAHVSAGGAALAVLHDLNLAARACDRLVLLSAGRVVASGPPRGVLDPGLLAEVYATDIAVSWDGGNAHVVAGL